MSLAGQSPTTQIYNVKDMGCACDGVFLDGLWTGTDDRAKLQRIIDVVNAAGGGTLYFPGYCMVSRAGGNPYCISLTSYKNIKFLADNYTGGIVQVAGLPNASVAIMRWNLCTDVTADGMYFSGNWGNAVTDILPASNNAVLPQAVINVRDTSKFPAAGSITIVTPTSVQVVTYTGKTATTFTGCAGGVGAINASQKVGRLDANTGINQTSQGDPQNYGIMNRGGQDNTIKNCLFEGTYGDAIWMGGSTNLTNVPPTNIKVLNCNINVSGRNGITLIGAVGVEIRGCKITNVFAGAIDSEPVGSFVRDVVIDDCYVGAWFNPGSGGGGQIPLTIVGGESDHPGQLVYARNYRVTNCTVENSIYISTALDILIKGNRIINSFFVDGFQGSAPIAVIQCNDSIKIIDNFIYDRTPGLGASNHAGSIALRMAANGALGRDQPANVLIQGNTIQSKAGTIGISVEGAGGGSINNAFSNMITGVATAVTGNTLEQLLAGWTVNAFKGWQVRVGTANASIETNTADTLTLAVGSAEYAALAWGDPLGNRAPTPAAGAFVIWKPTSLVEICDNNIDCSDDGWGLGGVGIFASAVAGSNSAGGMRIAIHDNTIQNADEDGIVLEIGGIAFEQVLVYDNTGFDNQAVATMTSLVRFTGLVAPQYDQLVLRNNAPHPSVVNAVSGLTTGVWLINGGMVPEWAGYGSPETVITAPIGAHYWRVNGSAGFVLYVKESGSAAVGWVAYANPQSASPPVVHTAFPVAGSSVLQTNGSVLTVSPVGAGASSGSTGSMFVSYQQITVTSLALAGSACGYRCTSQNYRRGVGAGGGFRTIWRFGANDVAPVATARMFCGLQTNTAAPTDVNPSTFANIIGVGNDNGDANLQLYASGAVAQPRVDLGASFPANTNGVDLYEIEISCDPAAATINWKLTRRNTGDVVSGVISVAAQLPDPSGLTQSLYRSNGGTALGVTVSFFSFYAEIPL